jgi:imidazole glycerol-phosphate synthase subunit HisH
VKATKSNPDVVLVDAGGSNIGSLRYAFQRMGIQAQLSADARRISAATHVILPGVGAAAPGMQRLRDAGLADTIRGLTQPVLGVCLGMQLLFEDSEEGPTRTLGLIPGTVALLPGSPGITVPHMGWNTILTGKTVGLLDGIAPDARFYFVHSYAGPVNAFTLASCDHGRPFAAMVQRGNFSGVQFHPERSGPAGARLLQNFVEGRT